MESMMRKLLSAGTFAALIAASPVFAADLPLKAAPVPFSWTGCYVGAHLGGVVSEDRTTNLLGNSQSFSSGGFVGGGQIGCDYQFASGWVLGAEGRAAGSSLTNTHSSTVRNLVTLVTFPSQFTVSNDFLASATARLGYSLGNRWLVFVRGGGAWTREKVDDAFTNAAALAVDPSASLIRAGWTVGTGVDWAFAPHWSATLEYNFYDFDTHSALLTSSAGPTTVNISSLKDTIHAVTAGVNYHF
jgi:outer membrane immunogenic protein